jgi:hypothetical protein
MMTTIIPALRNGINRNAAKINKRTTEEWCRAQSLNTWFYWSNVYSHPIEEKSWFNFYLSLMRETLIDEQNGMTLDKVLEYGVSQTEPT